MRVYVAAPWAARHTAREVAGVFRTEGFEITRNWWDCECADDDYDMLGEHAIEDIYAVEDADAFVLLEISRSEGKAVEMGVALASGIPVIVVLYGDMPTNIFQHHPGVLIVSSEGDALNALEALEKFACDD
jgi:glycosyltransferase involved in cell wall biosynthesis